MKILVVEDDELIAMEIERVVDILDYDHKDTVDNSDDAISACISSEIDLIIMDIHIQGSHDGIELADMIKADHDIEILFVTSMQDDLTFNRANRTNPVGFLQKPFSELQLKRSLELVAKKISAKSSLDDNTDDEVSYKQDSFFIRKQKKISKVDASEIFYFEADGGYTKIITDSDLFMVRRSLKEIFAKLDQELFIQCHRRYIINIEKVKSVDLDDDYVIFSERKVPFSRRERDNLIKKLNLL